MNEVKLISSGKILDNNKTVGQSRTPFGEVAAGIIIMHVVVQPSLVKMKTGISCHIHLLPFFPRNYYVALYVDFLFNEMV